MTALSVHTCCQYLTAGGNWRDEDYRARNIVKSVKGEDFNGFTDLRVGGNEIKLTKDNMDVGLDLAGMVLASRLVELTGAPVSLIPIPNSSACLQNPADFRTLMLAKAIEKYAHGKATAVPALLWKQAKDKQHQSGGYRNANQFTGRLALVQHPPGPVVLVDDVITSGSQMLAAAYVLRKQGIEVPFGMAVGRTTTIQTPEVLQWVEASITQLIM